MSFIGEIFLNNFDFWQAENTDLQCGVCNEWSILWRHLSSGIYNWILLNSLWGRVKSFLKTLYVQTLIKHRCYYKERGTRKKWDTLMCWHGPVVKEWPCVLFQLLLHSTQEQSEEVFIQSVCCSFAFNVSVKMSLHYKGVEKIGIANLYALAQLLFPLTIYRGVTSQKP